MDARSLFLAASLSSVISPAVHAAEVDNGWDARFFSYQPAKSVVVEQSTPTPQQVNFILRPQQIATRADELRQTPAAEPRRIEQMDVIHLNYADSEGDVVPALLCTPANRKGPFPVVIAVHGLTSNKAQVCAQVAPELIQRGFAVLAPDMPRHGERPGEPRSIFDGKRPGEAYKLMRSAVLDVRQAIDVAAALPQIDTRPGVVLVGYSMGSFINAVAGPADLRVKAMVLMVGGARSAPAGAAQIPAAMSVDPRLAIAHFVGRPLLMLNGRQDMIVNSDMAKRLYEAAPQPKEQIWYDCGHLLTADAYKQAAEWIAKAMAPAPGKS